MLIHIRRIITPTVLTVLVAGTGHARTYHLKKVLIINETGASGYVHTAATNYTSNYFKNYLGPKYGFTCAIPGNQAAIDSVMRDDSLKTYDVVIFNGGGNVGNAGAVGDTGAQHAFERWMKAGGGCLGIHGFLDHGNNWTWLRDSLLNGSGFTQHSAWGNNPNAKVQWDTLETNGEYRANKIEYDSIRACFPKTRFTLIDEWSSFKLDVRPLADVLMTVDESTYVVPNGASMGVGHAIVWAYHMPADSLGNQGRFLYFGRGHDVATWDGTSYLHSPMTVEEGAIQEGDTVFSDTSHTLMTKGGLWQSLQWAAGLRINAVAVHVYGASPPSPAQAQNLNGVLHVQVQGSGSHEVRIFTVTGKKIAHRSGRGDAKYTFANLARPCLYLVEVKSSGKTSTHRVLL